MALVGFAFIAGLLAALSPCVLPVLPVLVGSAARGHRAGPIALAAGLIAAFTGAGLLLFAAGAAIGPDEVVIRRGSALLLVVGGVVLLSATLHDRAGQVFAPLASGASRLADRFDRGRTGGGHAGTALGGQFALGALLGGVWSPCVGPTLGAAFGLASRTETLGQATLLLLAFGLGTSVPLVGTAYASRHVLAQRTRLLRTGRAGHVLLGAGLLVMGLLVWFELDKALESALLARLPQWWIDLLARF